MDTYVPRWWLWAPNKSLRQQGRVCMLISEYLAIPHLPTTELAVFGSEMHWHVQSSPQGYFFLTLDVLLNVYHNDDNDNNVDIAVVTWLTKQTYEFFGDPVWPRVNCVGVWRCNLFVKVTELPHISGLPMLSSIKRYHITMCRNYCGSFYFMCCLRIMVAFKMNNILIWNQIFNFCIILILYLFYCFHHTITYFI